MAVTFGFYDSVNNDRTYNAAQMSEQFQGFFDDGVFQRLGGALAVTAVSGQMKVNVADGRCWFDNTWTKNDAAYPITFTAPTSGFSQWHAVCIEVNNSSATRTNRITTVSGTPAVSPTKPSITNVSGLGVHQHVLAWVLIPGGATAITSAMITDNRGVATGSTPCPWVYIGVQVDSATALLKSGGQMTGQLSFSSAGSMVLGSNMYGTTLPASGTEGQIFFKLPEE